MTRNRYVTLRHPKMHSHTIWNSYLKEYRRYAPDSMSNIESRSEVKIKVTVTRKWYATLRHPKMQPHIKSGIPTSKNIGDMHRTRSGTDGQCNYFMPPKVPLGHKKHHLTEILTCNPLKYKTCYINMYAKIYPNSKG